MSHTPIIWQFLILVICSAWASATELTAGTNYVDIQTLELENNQDGTGVEYWYYDEVHVFTQDYTGDPTSLEQ